MKLIFDQWSTEARLAEMRRELATMQYKVSMGEEKVRLISLEHEAKTQRMVLESLDKGWKTWSAQVA